MAVPSVVDQWRLQNCRAANMQHLIACEIYWSGFVDTSCEND
eukprot:COSAG05_NODE_8855_length_666_cov_1.663139_2_plen_41_part_01